MTKINGNTRYCPNRQEQTCISTPHKSERQRQPTKPYLRDQLEHGIALHQFNKVLIVGLGQLGLPVARYVKERGFEVYGYDVNPKAMDVAEKTAAIKKATNFAEFDVYILCASTHKPDDVFIPEIDGLFQIANRIAKEAKSGALVSIESTIPKGTSRKVFEIFDHRLHVVHAPHRWYALEEKTHGVNQLRVIGGVCDCCLRVGMQFYSAPVVTQTSSGKSLGIPMHPMSNIEIAETTKVAENAHRYLQIAFAEELYLYCQANNINFPELRDALNTKWNVEILEPREGIGGHCLPKDTKMFVESSKGIKSKILAAAMNVDEDYRQYRVKREQELKSSSVA
jgi:UDP-N-acetyl-D-mannosaminuronic acid dehydrogenase